MTKQIGSETRQVRRARERKEADVNQSLSGLMRNTDIQPLVVHYLGEDYEFTYIDLDWETWMKHMSRNWGEDGTFNVGRYYQDMLIDSIQTLPDGSRPTRSILQTFAPVVMFKLMDIVPKPSLGEDVEASKNVSRPLETEAEEEETEND